MLPRNTISMVVKGFSAGGKELYGVKNSGWKSSSWNWGYSQGTGHDCALICRQRYNSKQSRKQLIDALLLCNMQEPANFEEVKLVLGLAIQRGRWDGSDGGPNGGYGDILQYMAEAVRYEDGEINECSRLLVNDMSERYKSLRPDSEQLNAMNNIWIDCIDDPLKAQRRCSGLVLQAMGFIEKGL